jgi:hypothetical protein
MESDMLASSVENVRLGILCENISEEGIVVSSAIAIMLRVMVQMYVVPPVG